MSSKKIYLSIDFDGTIVHNAYPQIGEFREDAKYFINKLYDEGFTIVINTCRSGRFEEAAKDFLIKHKVKYHYFNENAQELIDQYKSDCRKISADVYIDDRCLTGLPEWEEIYNIIKNKFQ